LQGFPEDALRAAGAGREILEVREHFFIYGDVPHIALVLTLGDGAGTPPLRTAGRGDDDPEQALPEAVRPLYRTLRQWRNEEAKKAGIPSYAIMRNVQLAEICRRLPRSAGALREIEGIGDATCARYGAAILGLLPPDAAPAPPGPPPVAGEGIP
jgi:superfamily II DNA helicase RecQ